MKYQRGNRKRGRIREVGQNKMNPNSRHLRMIHQ